MIKGSKWPAEGPNYFWDSTRDNAVCTPRSSWGRQNHNLLRSAWPWVGFPVAAVIGLIFAEEIGMFVLVPELT